MSSLAFSEPFVIPSTLVYAQQRLLNIKSPTSSKPWRHVEGLCLHRKKKCKTRSGENSGVISFAVHLPSGFEFSVELWFSNGEYGILANGKSSYLTLAPFSTSGVPKELVTHLRSLSVRLLRLYSFIVRSAGCYVWKNPGSIVLTISFKRNWTRNFKRLQGRQKHL